MAKLDNLIAQLQEQIDNFDKESEKHKKLYRRLRYSVFLLAAASTFLASLSLPFPDLTKPLNLTIVFVSAAVGVFSSIEGLRKPAELWIHERGIYYALKDLLREVQYYDSNGFSDEQLDRYFSRMQAILGASVEKWGQQVQPDLPPKSATNTVNPQV